MIVDAPADAAVPVVYCDFPLTSDSGQWQCSVCKTVITYGARPRNRVCGQRPGTPATFRSRPATQPRPLSIQAGPCMYRGGVVETGAVCELCGAKGELYDVYACKKHGKCSLSKRKQGLQSCGGCADFQTPVQIDLPIDAEKCRRNVIFHIWPVKGNGIWQTQVAELLKRAELFNGRRIVTVAVDNKTDSADAVAAALAGAGFDGVVIKNNPELREGAGWLQMLDLVKSDDPNELTFCCHAKGVTRVAGVPESEMVPEWTAALWETGLDNMPAIYNALASHTFAGSCKRYNDFKTPGNHCWHYSGGFYWLRHSRLFARDWRRIDAKWYGSESWPGLIVPEHEGACVFLDRAANLYQREYWESTVNAALAKWRQTKCQTSTPDR